MNDMTRIPTSEIRLAIADWTEPCQSVARAWCRSFGVHSQAAVERLAARLAAAPMASRSAHEAETLLHDRARTIIASWFSALGLAAEGRDFDRLRHAFLLANANGALETLFLAEGIEAARMASMLMRFVPVPTPPVRGCDMPRQRI
ncbi:MAG: hypothetical protein Kow00104_06810 [Rhodothalassiaceae bacterium]